MTLQETIELACAEHCNVRNIDGDPALDRLVNGLTAALSAYGAQQLAAGWHDISTAPRDGLHFLAWFPNSKSVAIIYGCEGGDYWFNAETGEVVHEYDPPTHWRPLPALPALSDRIAQGGDNHG